MTEATRAFIEIWTKRLKKESEDINFWDEEDRATFRGRIFQATRNASWDVLRRIASMLGEHDVPRSRDRTVRIIVKSWIDHMQVRSKKPLHHTTKKTTKQIEREVDDLLRAQDASLTVRPVRSSFSLTPTSYIATLFDRRAINFKRDTAALALRAALKYADVRGIKIENRSLIESRLQRDGLP